MKVIFATAFAALLLLVPSLVLAGVPGWPNQFWGTVAIDGAPASDGTSITSKVDGVSADSTTVSGGKYSLIVTNPEGKNLDGRTIILYVNGVQAATDFFIQGGVTELNLAITTSASGGGSSAPSGSGGGGGGGGGSGGSAGGSIVGTSSGGAGTNTSSSSETTCRERWLCSDWSVCKDGIQTRMCSDANSCGTNNNEPLSSQPCSNAQPATSEPTTASAGPLGFFFGVENTTWAGIIIGIAIIGLLIYAFRKGKIKIPSWHKGFSSKAV